MIRATYSVEDNKLRLYSTTRLDKETYDRIKALGFKWAPKQELFVAPKWTPQREDICIELAGEIEPEETTLAERAEAKAARIDEAIEKKQRQANAFSKAADFIGERFAFGQPILVGHHSERKARKDQEKMDRAICFDLIQRKRSFCSSASNLELFFIYLFCFLFWKLSRKKSHEKYVCGGGFFFLFFLTKERVSIVSIELSDFITKLIDTKIIPYQCINP